MPRARSTGSVQREKKKKNRTRRVRSASPETNLLKKLFQAVYDSDVATVRRLVRRGAIGHKDIPFHMQYSEISSMKTAIAHFSVTIAHYAYPDNAEDALQIFRILRDGGLEYSENTITPEVFVTIWQDPEIFEELINNRYDINTQHFRGHTMLMHVLASAVREEGPFTEGEYTDLINRLFDLGADINIQDEYGLDALMIASGHEAVDEFWYKFYGGGLGNEIAPEPYYVELLLENLKRTRQRYDFTNTAQNGDDFNGDEYTLEESLNRYGRENNDPQEYTDTVELIREYKLVISKPTKSARFGMVREPQTNRTSSIRSNSNNRSRSGSRSSSASEGGGKKKTRRRNKK